MLAIENIRTRTTTSLIENPDWQNLKWDLIIVDNPVWGEMFCEVKYSSCVQIGGFILIKLAKGHAYSGNVLKILPRNFQLISRKISESCEILLVRKVSGEQKSKKNLHFINVELDNLSWVQKAQDLIIRQKEYCINGIKEEEIPFLYFVSNGVPLSGILGFIRCLRKEPYGSKVRCIFSINHIPFNTKEPENDPILSVIIEKNLVYNVFNEKQIHGCYIHSEISTSIKVFSSNSFCNIETPRDLTTFYWAQGFDYSKHFNSLPQTHVPVKVYNTGLNFKDIMMATGNLAPEYISKYPTLIESPIGLEFAGIVEEPNITGSKPRRVCGLTTAQCLATQVFIDKEYLIDIPKDWAFEEAATVPVVYSTAYYALVIRGNIQRNSSILIHSGAGGVGIAAIRIALSYNCQIFTTVSSEKKIEFIRDTFPEIPLSNIGNSRDTRFEQMVRNGTNGYGVDLVLNSLTGDKLEASLKCLAPHGEFLEIGRVDMSKNKPIGSDALLQDVGFHSIFLGVILEGTERGLKIWKQIKLLMLEGINFGVVKPLPYRLFNKKQIEPAFRYMGQGIHIGKLVIGIREKGEEEIPIKVPSTLRCYFNPDKIYIIIAGLSGVGQELINWMTVRYARKIVITSRTGSLNLRGYTRSYLNLWKERGVKVEIYRFDPEDDIEPLFNFAKNMLGGEIGGIFNLAMHLEQAIFTELTAKSFERSLKPKLLLTKKLDEYSRKKDLKLDYFVVFSSVSSGMGHHGLSSYGFASNCMERVIEMRRKDKLSGRAIQLGPVGDVGAWHENFNKDYSRSSFHGSGIQSIRSVIKSLDFLLSNDNPSSTPIQFSRRTIELCELGGSTQALEVNLLDRLERILGHSDGSKLNTKSTLTELGLDSVSSIEARNVLENEFGLVLSATGLREYTLDQLNELAENKQNEQSIIRSQIPGPQPATANAVKLNLYKVMNIPTMQDEVVTPMNELAQNEILLPGPKVIICNSLAEPQVLRALGSYIKVPVFCIQIPFCLDNINSCEDLVLKFYEEIKTKVLVGPYVVVGFSAGVLPAFELGRLMQTSNEIIKLIMIDMSYERMMAFAEENEGLHTGTDSDASVKLLTAIGSHMYGYELSYVQELINAEPTHMEKIAALTKLIARATGEVQYGTNLTSDYYTRSLTVFASYKPSGIYDGEIGLVKANQNLIAYDTTSEDWGLSKICTKKVEIFNVDTTHSYILAEPAVQKVAKFLSKFTEI